MGCDHTFLTSSQALKSFNPRTHMGCDRDCSCLTSMCSVSIHAPTWGATHYRFSNLLQTKKFQSTHPHGVRQVQRSSNSYRYEFQSTHPHGVRPPYISRDNFRSYVSIHAPTWGATSETLHRPCRWYCFNPRTHMGCDLR